MGIQVRIFKKSHDLPAIGKSFIPQFCGLRPFRARGLLTNDTNLEEFKGIIPAADQEPYG